MPLNMIHLTWYVIKISDKEEEHARDAESCLSQMGVTSGCGTSSKKVRFKFFANFQEECNGTAEMKRGLSSS